MVIYLKPDSRNEEKIKSINASHIDVLREYLAKTEYLEITAEYIRLKIVEVKNESILNINQRYMLILKEFDFNAAMCINVTSLVTLTSLFIGASDSLPKTAQLKLIDYW